MKKYFRACMMSFTMFCAIPCPFHKWDDCARPLMTLFLPLVGLWIGVLWALASFLLGRAGAPSLATAALLCAFPFVITGFMHMDGFMDVTDAVKSWRDIEERRRILKDPHCGSFAVVACVLLIVSQFALFACAENGADFHALIFIPLASRSAAALAVTVLRPMTTSQYSGAYRQGIKHAHAAVCAAALAVSVAAAFAVSMVSGFAALAAAAGYGLALLRPLFSLGGMSGDISGYALTLGELCGIAVYALI